MSHTRGMLRLLSKGIGLILAFCLPVFSQVNTGRILGTVTDQTGAVIAGAMVVVTNVDTSVARNLTTDAAGAYNAPNLAPGNYSVRATAMGFQALVRQSVVVQVGTDTRVDVQLVPGQVTQTVEVTTAIPLVDTTSAIVSSTLNAQTIADLPLNGRNFERLLLLRPGQVQMPGGGTLTQESNGLRAEDSNYYVEGLDNDEPYHGGSVVNSPLTSGDAITILPVDAIQEFNVENNPPAEFGRKAGAVMNVGLKSGTNSIHGTAYAFGRDSAWDARNYFNPAPNPISPLNFEQWGGSLGGPIKKDKLFYFADFERQTYTVGNASIASVPSTADFAASGVPQGTTYSIPDAEAELAAHGFPVNSLSQKLLSQWGTNNTLSNIVSTDFSNNVVSNNVVAKVDYHPTDHHTFTGSFFRGQGTAISQDRPEETQAYFEAHGQGAAKFATASWTWTPNSTWVNDLRFGWTNFSDRITPGDVNVNPTAYGLNTGVTNPLLFGFPTTLVSGLATLGCQCGPSVTGPSNAYDIVDAVSYLRGKHSLKFGGDISTFTAHSGSFNFGQGTFAFNAGTLPFPGSTGLETFLAGVPTFANQLVGNPARSMKQWMDSLFAEDVYRVTSQLTLNLGLRWEYDSPLTEAHNLIGNWTPAAGLQQAGINAVNGNKVWNPDYRQFSPRLGVAWNVGGKGTTVVRAGYGIYYTNIAVASFVSFNGENNANTPGINVIPTGFSVVSSIGTVQPALKGGTIVTGAVRYPTAALNWVLSGATPILPGSSTTGTSFECGNGIGANPNPCNILVPNTNLKNPLVQSWNLSLEHSWTSNLSSDVAYVGNHSGNLPGILDVNQAPLGAEAAPSCPFAGNSAACLQIARPYFNQYPYLGFINVLTNVYESNYDALQATLTERDSHGLSFLIGYTYSHGLDDVSQYLFGPNPQNSYAPQAEYGNSNWDMTHHFTISLTYNIPGRKGYGQLLEGWSVNSFVNLQSGLPWVVIDGTDDFSQTSELSDRWDFFGNPKDFTANANPIPFYAAGSSMPAACARAAATIPNSTLAAGCYAQGNSAMIAPAPGNFGTMGRNIFRDSGYRNMDFSLFKNFKFKDRLTAQFRAEFFNILNHPNFANPTVNVTSDPSGPAWGAESATPDVAGNNPVLGTGGPREIQLGLKFIF